MHEEVPRATVAEPEGLGEQAAVAEPSTDATVTVPPVSAELESETPEQSVPSNQRGDSIADLLIEMEKRILDAFERKLAFDAVKERQIDRLHEELQGYRADLLAKAVRPVLQSLIRLHDDMGKVLEALERETLAQISSDRFLSLLKGFREDVALALSHNGVHAYSTNSETFDPRRQRVLRTVPSAEETQVGQIAARLRPGFEIGDTILEKERVAVYAMPQVKAAVES